MNQTRLAITMGDAAGIGPEVAIRALQADAAVRDYSPLLIGHPDVFRRAAQIVNASIDIQESADPAFVDDAGRICCWNPGIGQDVLDVAAGTIDARTGRAAYDSLRAATNLALTGNCDAVTTPPLNKAALLSAGVEYPGHTEILAEQCGSTEFAMMLYLPPAALADIRGILNADSAASAGLGIAHVTLHTSVASVPDRLSTVSIQKTIELMHEFLKRTGIRRPRVGVCALNPHAGEGGLFGDEETQLIQPAVESSCTGGVDASGPFPTDTLVRRAILGEFDGLVAMYHDQGHIPFKLIGFDRAINITLGLPIIRTSPSHGTAFEIAGKGNADPTGMIEAVRMATLLHSYKPATE